MRNKHIRIDLDSCIRSGQCFYMHPKLVRMRDDGYPELVCAEPLSAPDMDEALTLIDVCPVGAITIDALEQF
jgi:ferredoxin